MTDELLKALKMIKEICKSNPEDCIECPLADKYGNCGINNPPEEWRLEKREVWF